MKPGAILINLSRGSIVDINALSDKLADGSISGAGIDVYPDEPDANGDPFDSPLIRFPNVLLTPHIGGSTVEAQESIGYFVTGKLMDYWRKGATELSVNLPHIASSPSVDSLYRVAWIHHNTPGALARVNQVFATAGANINRQILATAGEIGYMVTDLSGELPAHTVQHLSDSEQNIRLRVLKREY